MKTAGCSNRGGGVRTETMAVVIGGKTDCVQTGQLESHSPSDCRCARQTRTNQCDDEHPSHRTLQHPILPEHPLRHAHPRLPALSRHIHMVPSGEHRGKDDRVIRVRDQPSMRDHTPKRTGRAQCPQPHTSKSALAPLFDAIIDTRWSDS